MRQRTIPRLPDDFVEQFMIGGWRRIENVYGARTSVNKIWVDMCGGTKKLKAEKQLRKKEIG